MLLLPVARAKVAAVVVVLIVAAAVVVATAVVAAAAVVGHNLCRHTVVVQSSSSWPKWICLTELPRHRLNTFGWAAGSDQVFVGLC